MRYQASHPGVFKKTLIASAISAALYLPLSAQAAEAEEAEQLQRGGGGGAGSGR